MEMFRGRARKRLQISQFPATALVGNPWPCFSRPNLCLSDTFLTAPYCPVGNSGWWVPTPDLRIPCLGHTREMLGSLWLVAFLALVQGLWFLSFSTFSQKTLSTEWNSMKYAARISVNPGMWNGNSTMTVVKNETLALTCVAQLVGIVPQSERSPVRFPVRAHAWVVGLVPGQAMGESVDPCFSPTLSPSLSHSLRINT